MSVGKSDINSYVLLRENDGTNTPYAFSCQKVATPTSIRQVSDTQHLTVHVHDMFRLGCQSVVHPSFGSDGLCLEIVFEDYAGLAKVSGKLLCIDVEAVVVDTNTTGFLQ